jgi:hypothetical protein
MKDKADIKESGAAGKPGESTAAAEKMPLTASGVENLLKVDFAADDAKPETAPAKEIPAAAEPGVDEDPEKEKIVELPKGDEPEKPVEAEPKAEDDPEKAKADETPLPEDAQAALTAWEETGGPLPPALQTLVDKRIGKLTGARDAEKTRADQAVAELAKVTAEAETLRNDPHRPAHVPITVVDDQVLTRLGATAKTFMAEAEAYLDDTATEPERTRVERYMAAQKLDTNGLKRAVRETSHWVAEELPAQRQAVQTFRQAEAAVEPVVSAQFPWLNDKASPEFAKAQQVLGIMPELRQRTPAHRVAAGTYVLGLEVMDHLAKAGVKTDAAAAVREALLKAFPIAGKAAIAKAKLPPPKTPAGTSAAAASKGKVGKDEAARQSFNKTPNRATATELARAALQEA